MRIIRDYRAIVILLVIALLPGCGKQTAQLDIGPDGYGKTIMANGIRVLVNHDRSTSLTAARVLMGGGVLTENSENNGITNLMINMLLKGNDTMTAAEITEQLDFLGADVSSVCYRDYSAISFTSLTENFDRVLEIISQSLLSPTFPEDELGKLKHEVEGDIKASNDNQAQASSKLFWKTAYGDQYYGLPTLGTEQSISSITVDDIKKHYQKYLGGNNIIFSVATDLPAGQINAIIHERLGEIAPEADTLTLPELKLQDEKSGFIKYDRNQSFIFMGVMLNHLEPNEVPYLVLLNEIMGNNVGSRLWYLRQKEKLAYSVYTQYMTDKYGGVFRAAIGTDTTKVKVALNSLNRDWNRLIRDGVTMEELQDARINMKNNLIYYIDRKSNRANYMAYYEYMGYGYRFVPDLIEMADRINLDELNEFVKDEFTEDRKFVSIVGKR
ncbi:MAG: insulinase family protein [Candidatus Zixiibacteriota bacterium]|nr:MAG: insulinase family protein [candidate division Zixibacteria bacterium]